jgi:hypothetical protein
MGVNWKGGSPFVREHRRRAVLHGQQDGVNTRARQLRGREVPWEGSRSQEFVRKAPVDTPVPSYALGIEAGKLERVKGIEPKDSKPPARNRADVTIHHRRA